MEIHDLTGAGEGERRDWKKGANGCGDLRREIKGVKRKEREKTLQGSGAYDSYSFLVFQLVHGSYLKEKTGQRKRV